MKENRLVIEINRPVAEVFEFTINPRNTHLWVDSIAKEETNELPIKLGTRYRNVNRQGVWSEYEVVKFSLNKVFELKMKDASYHVRYDYEPVSGAKTELTYFEWVEDGELDGPFAITTLEKLKRLMERRT